MAYTNPAAESESTRGTGLLASLQQLLASSAEVVRTRVAILSTELEEEGVRVRELFLLAQVALFFFGLGLLLVTLFVVLAFWDTHRLAVLASFAVLYLAIGGGTAWMLLHKLKTRPGLFASTLAELGKDRERLTSHL